ISSRLRQPNSGTGDDNLCRWLYDTFQSTDHDLQLAVLCFLPTLVGVYLSRAISRKPLAGFEAMLLALYSHETTSRTGQPLIVTILDISRPSIYHEPSGTAAKNNTSSDLNVAILSPTLEPHGTVRLTKRARIDGVALELYYTKKSLMPISSKMDFCEFCVIWAGQNGDIFRDGEVSSIEDGVSHSNNSVDDDVGECSSSKVVKEESDKEECGGIEGRFPLPWELLQPSVRILGHCLLGPTNLKELKEAASAAARSLHARALHINPQGILATGSLLRLGKMAMGSVEDSLDSINFQESGTIVITT
ncbi:hyccin, partial [Tasmannia lanceolata]|uniref:hyccin n=1 Tax=Tasmannia lanceolata TaxID=3420 RepID=UPI00406322C3